jgi:LytS/YehU family sensor histidine kinase
MKVNGDTENHTLAPMILQTFVENSFKHGANGISGDSWINIDLQVVQNKLTFSVINSKRKTILNEGHGIGLKNVRRRLELLYPGRYELDIKDSDDAYEVLLRLEL